MPPILDEPSSEALKKKNIPLTFNAILNCLDENVYWIGTETTAPIATYYPWLPLKENNTSYWYSDNTVIFPQKKHKNWEETIGKAIKYLDTKL